MAEKCRATSWRTAFCHPPEKRFSRGAAHSGVFAVRRLAFFAAFWSAVNRGLRPRKLMYFLTAKSTKNSPADASAYFVPANVRNGRLFAGFSRAFVSRLRHRAGVVRRETRREGCVRDKQKAQKPTIAPKGGGWGERNGSKKPAGCRAANNPRRSNPAAQADAPKGWGRTKRLKGPAVAGLRRSLPPKGSDTSRARTAECFMYSR